MLGWCCAFLSGIVWPLTWKTLPSSWIYLLLIACSLVLWCYYRYRQQYWPTLGIGFLLGMAWCIYHAIALTITFPHHYFNEPVIAIGTIVSIPDQKERKIQFEYLIDAVNNKPLKQSQRILCAQYTYGMQPILPIQLGERWQLTIHLKQPRGFWNPGSFDYQAWLLQKGISATGTLVYPKKNTSSKPQHYIKPQRLPAQTVYPYPFYPLLKKIDQWRSAIKHNIHQVIPKNAVKGLLNALIIGMREEITDDQWVIMRATGTNHLFAISGLHIGFIGGLLYVMTNYLWRRIGSLSLYQPAQQVAYIASWIGACGYSLLSGFALPVQRAIIMMTVFIIALLKQRVLPTWRGWCIALCILLILHPLVVLTESFWLSFGAVAIIFYGLSARLPIPHQTSTLHRVWQNWGKTQWVISVGLVPLTALFFNQITLIGFFGNLIAIPWVGFLVLPISLVGALMTLVWPALGALLLLFGSTMLSILWQFLVYIAQLPGAQTFFHIPNHWILFSTNLSIILYLAPKGFPGRYYLSLVWLLPLLLYQTPAPLPGQVWLTLLDVGQGLSAVIRTQTHVLVYDTGPRFSTALDAGNAVLLPYLHRFNIKKVDQLIISHGDNDHNGGTPALVKGMCIKNVVSSQPYRVNQRAQYCHIGQQWKWDGVTFKILHPPKQHSLKANDSSCVLQIDNGAHRILLPGDIQRKAERQLVKQQTNLSSTIVIAPHHGSKTSSSYTFINATNPRYVLLPVGYRNRFKFPNKQVIQRYKNKKSALYSTAEEGAIMIQLGVKKEDITVQTYRISQGRFWHNHF